ncbi:VWA domain-containing protein [Streptococcus pneumoniae]|nr:DUF5979 domain-containing protein [Streptococcus pneumoniae]UKP43888.1 VWA domain-containing protein [Streptococcus pneumoniae]
MSSYDDAKTLVSWSTDSNSSKNIVSSLTIADSSRSYGMDAGIGTGTNINAGLTEAQRLLQSARAGAKKVVILLSDGEANMYYESNSGRTIYNYYSNPNVGRMIDTPYWFTSGLERGMLNISSLIAPKIDGFYSIKFRYYIGSNDSITSLKGYISGYNSGIPNEIFSANNENDLQQKFKEITDKILPLGVHHVTISDVLSKYVQLLPGDASHLRVVKIKDGNEQELNDNQVTIETKKNEQGLVEVTAKFNPSYTLEDDAKYVLKFTVTSSQEAFDAIAGDKTLTSDDAEEADATKLYSNKGAKVAYSYGIGTSRTKIKDYSEKPTFKPSDPLTVPVEIEWKGVDGKSNPSANRPPSVELNLNQKKDGSIKDSYRKVTSPVQTNSFTENTSFAKVAKGYDYELKAPDAPGYTVEVQKTGTKEKPSFKVIYRQLPSLTVKKILEGEQSPNKSFTINVTFSDKDGKPINGKFGNTTVTNGKAQISLKNSQETALSYLPRDTHYKVEEVENSRTGYHVTYEKQEGTLSEDVQTIVTNHRLPTLSVTKKVTGAFANLLQSFKITINVKDAQNKPLNGSYSAIVNNQKTTLQFTNGKATVDLKKDKTIKILDLPLNARYSIEEEASSSRGYQVSYDKKEGTLDANKSATVTNNKNSVPETGIDFLSSTLVLGVVLPLGGIFFIILLGHLVVNRRK